MSENPRRTRTLAAAGSTFRAAERAATTEGSSAGKCQRADGLILGEIPAKRVAFVVLALCNGAGDLVFRDQKFFVPVGLEFVDVQSGIVIERKLERAGNAFVDAQFAEARLVIALLVAVQAGILELFQQVVDVARFEFTGAEKDHLDAGLDGGVEEHPVVGIMFAI